MFKYQTQKMEMYYGQVVEMHRQGCSIRTIEKKLNVSKGTIRRWIRNFAEENRPPVMPKKTSQKVETKLIASDLESDDIRELKVRIRQLEKRLKDEKLRADAYDMLITIAEEDFKIPIRKKGGAER